MYGWDTLVLLRHLLEQGLGKTAIAARLGVSRRVLYDWIAAGELDRLVEGDQADGGAPPPRRYTPRQTNLDAFTALIDARLASYPELSAVRLYAEAQAAGYAGSLTQLKAYVRRVRPQPAPEPVVRFETPPGHQAQVDFAEVRFPWGKRFVLLVVLGYSRLLWLRFYDRQTMAVLMDGLEAAFAAFGGVPRELLFDQLKAVVISDGRLDGGKLLENAEFLRFAAHWSFRIRACRPYRAQTKGKVERPIRYLRESFLYGREFVGDGDLAAQADAWVTDLANARVHGTTREVPRARFARDERAVLQPLAARPYRPLVLPGDGPRRPIPRCEPRVVPSRRVDLPAAMPASMPAAVVPAVTVERRPLAVYAALAEEVA